MPWIKIAQIRTDIYTNPVLNSSQVLAKQQAKGRQASRRRDGACGPKHIAVTLQSAALFTIFSGLFWKCPPVSTEENKGKKKRRR